MKAHVNLSSIEVPFHVDISTMLRNEGDIAATEAIMRKMECGEIKSAVEKDEDIDGKSIVHVYVSSRLYIWLPLTIMKEGLEEAVNEKVIEPLLLCPWMLEVWAEAMPEIDMPDISACRRSQAYANEMKRARAEREKARAERRKNYV